MLIHCTKVEVLALARKRGLKVIGDCTFSTMLGAYQFIQNLGQSGLDVRRFGTSVFLVVRSTTY